MLSKQATNLAVQQRAQNLKTAATAKIGATQPAVRAQSRLDDDGRSPIYFSKLRGKKICVLEDKFGRFRAVWADEKGKPKKDLVAIEYPPMALNSKSNC